MTVKLNTYFIRGVVQLCLTLCGPMDCSPPGFSVSGTFQARILEGIGHFLLQGIFLTQASSPGILRSPALEGRFPTTSATYNQSFVAVLLPDWSSDHSLNLITGLIKGHFIFTRNISQRYLPCSFCDGRVKTCTVRSASSPRHTVTGSTPEESTEAPSWRQQAHAEPRRNVPVQCMNQGRHQCPSIQ